MLGFEAITSLQNPVILPTVPCEPLELLTFIREIIKIYGPREYQFRIYCLRNFCPHHTTEAIDLKMKIFGKTTLKKQKNDPIE